MIILRYYLLAPVANLRKQTNLERYVPRHTLTDLCLLLHKLKMSITISNWGFTNTKDYMPDATINQIILKIPTRGFPT